MNLFSGKEDFFNALEHGTKLITDPNLTPPAQADLPHMKALLAVFITSTIQMDPDALNAPDWDTRISTVRLALLAAYDLGKKSP